MTTGRRYEDEQEYGPGKPPLGVMVAIFGMVLTLLGQTVGLIVWTDHRLTILETNYLSISRSLANIETKLDGSPVARNHSP